MSARDVTGLSVSPEASISEAVFRINSDEAGIALVTDSSQRLIATIVDGDVRRAILAGVRLDASVRELLESAEDVKPVRPVTAPVGAARSHILGLMEQHVIRQVPLLDKEGRVCDLVTIDDLIPDHAPPLQAVIMAGGYGTRLRPLTSNMPKPMLPVGDKPIMEQIIGHLKESGIERVNVMTHFMGDKIRSHFGDGRSFGVEIDYVSEDQPLGTAGSLGLMKEVDEPLLIINGDVLTTVDFRGMQEYHRKHGASMTVGVRQYDFEVPYGVLQCEGNRVRAVEEKPAYSFFVNAGIYMLEPSVCRHVPGNRRFDMTDLISTLLEKDEVVVSFPIIEYWLDIGERAAYEQACRDSENGALEK